VTLSADCLMQPLKSTSGIMGVIENALWASRNKAKAEKRENVNWVVITIYHGLTQDYWHAETMMKNTTKSTEE
jgi:hypothetical protein